ncbi:uncharacterized protein LOC107824179 [Nicotiana tabacum]|uniref:Uncharacterized protein n=1 Tax=Nicotiana tabacum TaxID=4097 RepID=A0A1S4CZI6_TOBAC|nr:PREDICTED: uncharacterized protein LOC107824179 [Nicotiana tabacum]XP_016506410.1 PREDICTED: uncharacterized protein LOC107824179 [Nicotiana tabacum]
MKPSKNENEVASTLKAATKYAFVAPGAIGKGRRRGLKSLSSLGVSRTDIPFFPSTDQVMQYNQIVETTKGRGRGLRSMCSLGVSGMGPTNKNPLVFEKGHMKTNIPSFSSTDDVMQYIQKNSASALGKRDEGKSLDLCAPLKNLKMKSDPSIKILIIIVEACQDLLRVPCLPLKNCE